MSVGQRVRVEPTQRPHDAPGSAPTDPISIKRLGRPVRRAIARTRQWLLAQQLPDGHWCAELEGDTILESETILLWAYLGLDHSDTARRAAEHLLTKQLPAGGWAMYPGGTVEISASVKAYFALKLTGHDPSAEPMQRARNAILAHGGADAVNSFTRFYLALLGQISYDHCPAVPPEIMLLPKWLPLNLYAVSSWSRAIIVPLSIVSAMRPVCQIDPRRGIRELFLKAPQDWPPLRCPGLQGRTGWLSWDRFFRTTDAILKWCQRHRLLPLRSRAIAKAEKWMLERFRDSDGLGAIYPPIVWCILALRCLGYDDDSPEMQQCLGQLDDLVIDDHDAETVRLQPCKSPVWDTAITLRAISASGIGHDSPPVCRAVDWLLQKQVTRRGDWAETVDVEPGGWSFEYRNDFYPDLDDTAAVLTALRSQCNDLTESSASLPPELRLLSQSTGSPRNLSNDLARMAQTATAIERGLKWTLAMQNDDGGWAAFDRNNNRQFLCYVPFADHNAMIDPSTVDITGGVLECLGKLGRRLGDPSVDRGVALIRAQQEPDGSWFGRWGVNYIYGTWKAITGMTEVGVPPDDPAVVAGANWLLACQQPCGGWGESPETYAKPHLRGQGPPTASQTAWALMALLAAGLEEHPAVTRAVRFLIESQSDEGVWHEPEFTGTGFPQVFYLHYHNYPIYFPLIALAQWTLQLDRLLTTEDPPPLRLVAEAVQCSVKP
ncbi:MAG: squalene--hopene cyclase [Planctomycetes bacterium RBG_13_63_9]|nr:MAG: squalene--hopene cyclase [Planctomycetes bacterium RBG_13_63_9]